jgi:hypothetical protein
MVDRDLRINATADTSQAEAAVDSLNEKLGETTAAQVANTEATDASAEATAKASLEEVRRQAILDQQAAKLRAMVEAQMEAKAAVAAMADAADAGGKRYAAAIDLASAAVARLDVLQRTMQAAGGPVSEAEIAELAKYDAAVAAAAASTEKAASSTAAFSTEAALMRGNVMGLSRALVQGAKDSEGLGGAFSQMALPIAAAIGAMALIPLVLEKIQTGATKVGEAIADYTNDLTDNDLVTRKASESTEAYDKRVQDAANSAADMQRASIAMGAALIDQTKNTKDAVAAWQGHLAAMTGNIEQYPAFVAKLKEMGVSLRATMGEMKSETQAFDQVYQAVLKKDGPAAAKYFADNNKAALDRIISYYEEMGLKVPANLKTIQESIGLVTKAEQEAAKAHDLRQHFLDTMNATEELKMKIDEGTHSLGSQGLAVEGLSKEIVEQIDVLTKMKNLTGAEEEKRKAELESLNSLAVKYGILHGKYATIADDKAALIEKDRLIAQEIESQLDKLPRLSDAYNALSVKLAQVTQEAIKTKASLDAITAGQAFVGGGHATPGPPVEAP